MIHVDLENEILEFEGTGQDMLTEIGCVIAASLEDVGVPDEDRDGVIDLITMTLGVITKIAMQRASEEESEEGGFGIDDAFEEKGDISKKRDIEAIHTAVKQFRRRR